MDEKPEGAKTNLAEPPPEVSEESKPAPEITDKAVPTPVKAAPPEPTGEKPVAKTKKVTTKKAQKKSAAKKTIGVKKAAPKKKVPPRKDVPKNLTMPLARIVLSDYWNRQKLGDNSGMVSSLKDVGLITPISIWPIPGSTKYELIAGRRRYAGALELGWKNIKVTICKGNLADLRMLALVENLERIDNTPYELAVTFQMMVTEHNKTNEQIAKSCGRTPGFVSQYLAVTKAPGKLQRGLAQGIVGVSIFRYFTKLDQVTDKAFYDKMVEAVLNGLPGSKVDNRISAYLEKKESKAAAKAKATGAKAPPNKPRKGAAAHNKRGAELVIRDYSLPAVRKAVKMVNKTTALVRLKLAADKLKRATRKDRVTYLQGVVDGLEEAAGLVAVTED